MLPITIVTAVQKPTVRARVEVDRSAASGMRRDGNSYAQWRGTREPRITTATRDCGRIKAVISILRRERKLVRRFREIGATTPASARTLEELHLRRGVGVHRLRNRAVIREAEPDRFYLDEEVWEAIGRTRRQVSIAVLCLIILFLIAVVAVRRLHAF